MTLWIGAAALGTMILMFVLGLSRGQSAESLFITAIALAIAAIPTALPTVLQVILSAGAKQLAAEKAIVKDLVSVETLGSTSAINSDKTGTLTMNQVTVVEVLDAVDRYVVTGIGYSLDGQVQHPAGTSLSIDDAILPYIITNDAKLEDGKVVGDPTEGALLVLGHKAGLDIDASRARFPRLTTLPFDPVYKLMAAFCSTTDATGKNVVRIFVKGAAPAVFDRTGSALAGGETLAWDDTLKKKADDASVRMAGEGHRVMAAAVRDLDPAAFDPQGDLLGYVTDLQLTSVVGMVDPPREESKAAVRDAQLAQIRVRMVTGDDVTTGAAIAQQLGIPGEAMLGTDFAALSEQERLRRIDDIGVVGRVAPEHKVLLVETLRKKGARGRHDRRRRQRRAGHQGRRHRHRHGQRHGGGQERRPHDPLGRQLRDHREGRREGPRSLRQPQQVHPLRDARAGGLHHHLPRREHPQHRRRPAVLGVADPVHQLPRQRAARHRPRHGQGDARAHGPRAETSRRDDHDARPAHHRRPRRAVHGRRARWC